MKDDKMKYDNKKYVEHKKKVEKILNEFPCFFAFSETDFNEGLTKLKVKKDDVLSVGFGQFIRKADKEKYKQMWLDIHKLDKEFFSDGVNLFNAFYYELGNHEFAYSHDIEPTLYSLNLSYDELTDEQKEIFEKAKTKYLNSQIW